MRPFISSITTSDMPIHIPSKYHHFILRDTTYQMKYLIPKTLQEGNWARPHLCTVARHGLDLFGNGSSETMYDDGQSSEAAILL